MSLSKKLLGAPLPTTPVTFILVHFFAQSFSSFRSTCSNYLNLVLWILFSTHAMRKRLKSYASYHFKDTPHILSTIILSVLLNLSRSSAFIAHVLLPYPNTFGTLTGLIYFPLQFQRDTPFCQNWCYLIKLSPSLQYSSSRSFLCSPSCT